MLAGDAAEGGVGIWAGDLAFRLEALVGRAEGGEEILIYLWQFEDILSRGVFRCTKLAFPVASPEVEFEARVRYWKGG